MIYWFWMIWFWSNIEYFYACRFMFDFHWLLCGLLKPYANTNHSESRSRMVLIWLWVKTEIPRLTTRNEQNRLPGSQPTLVWGSGFWPAAIWDHLSQSLLITWWVKKHEPDRFWMHLNLAGTRRPMGGMWRMSSTDDRGEAPMWLSGTAVISKARCCWSRLLQGVGQALNWWSSLGQAPTCHTKKA